MQHLLPYYLGFSYFLGIGPSKFDLLIDHFNTVKKAYTASRSQLEPLLGSKLTEKFITFRAQFDPEKEIDSLQKKSVIIVSRDHVQYPPQFLRLPDPPICLFVKGDLSHYDFKKDIFFAIVGTRSPTDYGKQIAQKFATELSASGMIIVSGMALGIDAQAHWAAIHAGGKTIAFLGCGVNIIYPPSNKSLYETILDSGGLIISEFPPDLTVLKGLFVSRNRLISALSIGTLVAEGLKDSGSLITAKCALEQGKEVFAPPAPITSIQSQAPNMLIKEGATMVTCVEDILDEFKMTSVSTEKNDIAQTLIGDEQVVYQLLLKQPYSADDLAQTLQLPIHQILTALSSMEIQGYIVKGSAGTYMIQA